MNHATWSAGSLSAPNWRPTPNVRPPHGQMSAPRQGSPRRDRRKLSNKKLQLENSHSTTTTKSNDPPPGPSRQQLSLNCDCHSRCHSYHYLDINESRSTPITPVTSSQRKKYSPVNQQGGMLAVEDDNNITRSPSAPNLQATSMLVLQGSMAGFTAMAAGNSQQRGGNVTVARTHSTPPQRRPVVQCRSPATRRSLEVRVGAVTCSPPGPGVFQPPRCTCNSQRMSPTRHLKAHTYLPQEELSPSPPKDEAWQRRRSDVTVHKTADGNIGPTKVKKTNTCTQNRHLQFQETRV